MVKEKKEVLLFLLINSTFFKYHLDHVPTAEKQHAPGSHITPHILLVYGVYRN